MLLVSAIFNHSLDDAGAGVTAEKRLVSNTLMVL